MLSDQSCCHIEIPLKNIHPLRVSMKYAEVLSLLLFFIQQVCWHIHDTKRAVFVIYLFAFKS